MEHIITIISSVIGGGVVGTLVGIFTEKQKRKAETDLVEADFNVKIQEMYVKFVEDFNKKYELLRTEREILEREHQALKKQHSELENTIKKESVKDVLKKNSFLLFILILSISIGLLSSCKSTKTQTTDIQHITKTDTLIIEKEKAVFDTIFVDVPFIITEKKECDTICQKALNQALTKLKILKKNGENKTGFYFDSQKNQLVLYQNLSEKINTYRSKNQQVSNSKETIKKIEKKYIPMWFYVFAFLGWILAFVLAKILVSQKI